MTITIKHGFGGHHQAAFDLFATGIYLVLTTLLSYAAHSKRKLERGLFRKALGKTNRYNLGRAVSEDDEAENMLGPERQSATHTEHDAFYSAQCRIAQTAFRGFDILVLPSAFRESPISRFLRVYWNLRKSMLVFSKFSLSERERKRNNIVDCNTWHYAWAGYLRRHSADVWWYPWVCKGAFCEDCCSECARRNNGRPAPWTMRIPAAQKPTRTDDPARESTLCGMYCSRPP